MAKNVLIAYVSTTGNTEAMANAIFEGAKSAGAEVCLVNLNDATPSIDGYDTLLFGSPAMGAEVLEESFMEPFFSGIEGSLSGRNVALFGSYDWGDGQWLSDWTERCINAGAKIVAESLKIHLAPDAEGIELCKKFGEAAAR